MQNNYYVYIYRDPLDDTPFYVGKGCEDRYKKHLYEKKETTENLRKYSKIQKILCNKQSPIIEFFRTNLTEDEAYKIEERLIAFYGRKDYDLGGILTNICSSSRPPSNKGKVCKESTKKKISQSNLGRVFSEEHKIKLSLAAKNRPKRVMSQDTKNKISASNKGKIRTNEYLERISSIRKGKKWYSNPITGKRTQCYPGLQPEGFIARR